MSNVRREFRHRASGFRTHRPVCDPKFQMIVENWEGRGLPKLWGADWGRGYGVFHLCVLGCRYKAVLREPIGDRIFVTLNSEKPVGALTVP